LTKFRYYNLVLLDAVIEKDPFKIDSCILELKVELEKMYLYHTENCIYKRSSLNQNIINDLDTKQTEQSETMPEPPQDRN